MVPPLPAASRPSKTMMTRRPLRLTQSWSSHSCVWSFRNSFMYCLPVSVFDSLSSGAASCCAFSSRFLSLAMPASRGH